MSVEPLDIFNVSSPFPNGWTCPKDKKMDARTFDRNWIAIAATWRTVGGLRHSRRATVEWADSTARRPLNGKPLCGAG